MEETDLVTLIPDFQDHFHLYIYTVGFIFCISPSFTLFTHQLYTLSLILLKDLNDETTLRVNGIVHPHGQSQQHQ